MFYLIRSPEHYEVIRVEENNTFLQWESPPGEFQLYWSYGVGVVIKTWIALNLFLILWTQNYPLGWAAINSGLTKIKFEIHLYNNKN